MRPEALIKAAAARAPYLGRLLGRDPDRLERVAADPYLYRAKPEALQVEELDQWITALGPRPDDENFSAALRHYRADELVRCGVRELSLEKPIEVGEELAHLADACLDAAIAFHRNRLEEVHGPAEFVDDDGTLRRAELVVIAMGKHGAEELNFASDIDIIYVYSSDAGPDDDDRVTLHTFFTDLCRRVSAALGEVTDEDVVFRVDLRLRPEGSRGAMANSLPSLERYYESWGRPWERQAWLKARACAGSQELGSEVMKTMRPFVYPRSSSVDVIGEVTALSRQIKAEQRSGGINQGFDVKNGVGGIRDIEFFVQALQLLWSPSLPQLRTRSTIGALDQLLFAGIITEVERQTLGTAYRFMRHVEHLLQLDSGRQTQRLPGDTDQLAELALRLNHSDLASFQAALEAHTEAVAAIFATLSDAEEPAVAGEVSALLAGHLSAEREIEVFRELGFAAPQDALAHLNRARRLANSPFGVAPRGAAAKLAPLLFSEISRSPDPDQAFVYASDLAARRSSFASVWRMMAEKPSVLRLVASLFGTSHFLSRHFVSHPELIDYLLLAGNASPRVSRAELTEGFEDRLAVADGADSEELWDAIAEAKISQHLRIGLADIAGDLSPLEVCAELSLVADECLARTYALTCEAMIERYGWPQSPAGKPIGFSVIGLGKLGGCELGYASDLDVVFVFEEDGESDGERKLDATTFFTRLAQRLMRGLHVLHRGGRLYELDTRLRPLGSKGLLVSSMAAWRNYHQNRARLWERQALIKLRPVVGDRELGEAVANESRAFVYRPDQDKHAIAIAISEMRARIEQELAKGTADLKTGRGGLVDVEFAAQYIQLVHGYDEPRLQTQRTIEALEITAELGLADSDACATLSEGYLFLRFLEHRMRIVHDRSVATVPVDGLELDKLARRAGYPRGEALWESYRKWTELVRDAFRQVVRMG